MKKKINKKLIYGMLLPLFAIILVSAAVLNYYGTIQQEFNVIQAVELTCPEGSCIEVSQSGFNGEMSSGVYSVKNIADTPRDVKLKTICKVDGSTCSYGEVTTNYVGVLELTMKDPLDNWKVLPNKIDITYTIVGNTFDYEITSGIIPQGFEVVYAMDKENRFTDYATVKTISEIDEDLPMIGDWNFIADPDYANNDFDSYEHTRGAKIWIVDTNDIGENGVLNWVNMNNYYYETDLIVYSIDNIITIPAGGGFDFRVENNIKGTGNYNINTTIIPA